MPTIFEKIVKGEIPSNKVYEDDKTFAFLDASPVNPGHTLVVPKKPYKDIYDIPEDIYLAVMKTVHRLSPVIKEAVDADGINLGQNNEPVAGQEVFHFHVHIIPRFKGDGFEHWHGAKNYHDGENGERVAERVRELITK